jgi:hypothetical protein
MLADATEQRQAAALQRRAVAEAQLLLLRRSCSPQSTSLSSGTEDPSGYVPTRDVVVSVHDLLAHTYLASPAATSQRTASDGSPSYGVEGGADVDAAAASAAADEETAAYPEDDDLWDPFVSEWLYAVC